MSMDHPPPQVREESPVHFMLHQGALEVREETSVAVRSPHQHSGETRRERARESQFREREGNRKVEKEEGGRTLSVLETSKVVSLSGTSSLAELRGPGEEKERETRKGKSRQHFARFVYFSTSSPSRILRRR